jgi:cyanophycinase
MATKSKKSPAGNNQGTLIIIGGHEDHDGDRIILKEVAGHISNGRLTLATIASHEPDGYLQRYQHSFSDLGISEVVELYVEDRAAAAEPDKLKVLEGSEAIFFSGGDQLRITSQIGDTPLFNRIHEIYQNGGVIAGTSAGASVMSDTMLVKGPSDTSFRLGDLHMAPGLGLLPNVIIDQHFAQRGRIGRLLGAVAHNPRVLGIGLDEDTAIVVTGHSFKVIGSGAVYIIDGAAVSHSNIAEGSPDAILSIYGLILHILCAGDGFDLKTRRPQQLASPRDADAAAKANGD